MKYAIVTGVSKGLGASIATYLLESGIHVFGLSRSGNDGLYVTASENNMQYEHLSCDLSSKESLIETVQMIQEQLKKRAVDKLYVVNNAGVVEPIQRATEIELEDWYEHYQVNVFSPIYILSTLIKDAEDVEVYGVNITSGAAERATYGWSAYGSSKASLNMFTKTLALELDHTDNKHKVFAFSPGIMDTDMQAQIRKQDEDAFRDVDTFRKYKETESLSTTHQVASILVDILTDEVGIENGKIYSVRDYL